MPRIRTVKPEAPQHRKVGRLSISARWLWLVMITQADDEGRLVADPGQLRITAFPYDRDVTDSAAEDLLNEIEATGLIRLYEVNGVPYAYFPSWRDHQRINRPSPSKLPSYQDSVSAHGTCDEASLRTHAGSEGKGSEGIKDQGTERKGEECEGRETNFAGDVSPAAPSVSVSLSNNIDSTSNGPTYRRPTRGEYQLILAEVSRCHPELSEAERQERAMRIYHGELTS